MMASAPKAGRLAILTVTVSLILAGPALWFGVADGAIALWGFGAVCLLQVPPALSLRLRIREGLDNRGLERERLTLRIVSYLMRLLALGMALASVSALGEGGVSQGGSLPIGLAILGAGSSAFLWRAKRGLIGIHPAFDHDAARSRTLLEFAVLLLAGALLGRWFPWGDALIGLVLALRVFLAGRALAKGTTLELACGGCGSGCGCG